MELKELRSFCAAAKFHSMSKAAEYLQVGQPTVTTHVKKLEEELGMVLFDRVKRPIQLTLAGQSLAQLATPLVEGIEALVSKTAAAEETGPIAVACTPDIIAHALLQGVRAFRLAFPSVHLGIRSRARTDVLDDVERGEVDLGILPAPERMAELDFRPLFTYERVLIAPRGHPILQEPLVSLEQIAKWPLILTGPRTLTRSFLEAEFRRRGLSYDIVMDLDSMDVIKRYVALGLGISVGPRLAIDSRDVPNLGMQSMATLLPVEQAGIVTMRGKALSKPTKNFIEVMQRSFASATGG